LNEYLGLGGSLNFEERCTNCRHSPVA